MNALAGRRIAVTRPGAQAEELAAPLRAAGAEVLIAPLIRVVPAPVEGALAEAMAGLERYDWLVFTSANGVQQFMAAAGGAPAWAGAAADERPAIACVGPATAAAAAQYGLTVDAMPETFIGDSVADAMAAHAPLEGARVLLARAGGARAVLPERLRELGATVDDIELYRSLADEQGARLLRQEISADRIDILTFTSGSAVRYFSQHVGAPGRARCAVIGPATAEEARARGITVTIEADPHTTEALVAAIVAYCAAQRA